MADGSLYLLLFTLLAAIAIGVRMYMKQQPKPVDTAKVKSEAQDAVDLSFSAEEAAKQAAPATPGAPAAPAKQTTPAAPAAPSAPAAPAAPAAPGAPAPPRNRLLLEHRQLQQNRLLPQPPPLRVKLQA
jgi:hypothetical protein